MDITLSFLPWKIIWHLQMRKKEKFGIGLAMNMGVLWALVVPCCLGTHTNDPQCRDNKHRQVHQDLDACKWRLHMQVLPRYSRSPDPRPACRITSLTS